MKRLIVLISVILISIISCEKDKPEKEKTTCFTEIDTVKANSSIINKWSFVGYIDTTENCKPDSFPEINIEFIDSTVFRGFDGCNGYNGKYEILSDNKLHTIGVIGTTIFCAEIYSWEIKFIDGLRYSKSYKIQGKRLWIDNENGYKLVFKQI